LVTLLAMNMLKIMIKLDQISNAKLLP